MGVINPFFDCVIVRGMSNLLMLLSYPPERLQVTHAKLSFREMTKDCLYGKMMADRLWKRLYPWGNQ